MPDVLHPSRNYNCQTFAVRNRRIPGAQFMFHPVGGPVFDLSQSVISVVCKRSGQTDLAPSVVILRILFELQTVLHDRLHGAFSLTVHKVGIFGLGKVALHDVTHHVDHTCSNLLFRKRKEKFGIDDAYKLTN